MEVVGSICEGVRDLRDSASGEEIPRVGAVAGLHATRVVVCLRDLPCDGGRGGTKRHVQVDVGWAVSHNRVDVI